MSGQKFSKKPYLTPMLLIAAILVVLGMLRLGIWQLDRAAQKQAILDQVVERAEKPSTPITELLSGGRVDHSQQWRFTNVSLRGRFLADYSILIDNQVRNRQGGYQLFTPFAADGLDQWIMVSRGWLAAGATRQDIPRFDTPSGEVSIVGRLNTPPARPPLWKEGFPVSDGKVWQYLPIDEYEAQMKASVLPLVVELAPENEGAEGLLIQWQKIDDGWVAKHKGYAFQWFSMALAFVIACVVLLLRRRKKLKHKLRWIKQSCSMSERKANDDRK